jgi:sulfate adenylyltransferase subunit 1 (EFTu-like GTPase family)
MLLTDTCTYHQANVRLLRTPRVTNSTRVIWPLLLSNADLAILLLDATKGIRLQTHRHLTVCALMGVRAVIVAVNKMDVVGYSQNTFEILSGSVHRAACHVGIDDLTIIPVSALVGDNLVTVSQAITWYRRADSP